MSEPDEINGTVQAVRIGQNHEPAEITIFYTPHKGLFLFIIYKNFVGRIFGYK